MNKETAQAVIQDILNEYGGFIDDVDEIYYGFTLLAPNKTTLFVSGEMPDDIEDKYDFKQYIFEEIRSTAFDFDIDEAFDHIYEYDEMTLPSIIMARLEEDKKYFENI